MTFFSDRFDNGNRADSFSHRQMRDHETVNLNDYLSEQTKEFLQRATEQAVKFGKREVDTEHLLYVLPESDVVQATLKQFKLSPNDLRGYIEQNASRGDLSEQEEENAEIGVSPRVKSALERAFTASRELGHSYVGPEHLLIGLAEVQDSFAGNLLQVFDDGRLTDGKGRVVDFTNTIIIATSNLGSDLIMRNLQSEAKLRDDILKRQLMDVLRQHFRPEFLNRIDEIIIFHALDRDQIQDIVRLQLEQVRRAAEGQGIRLEFDDC